MTGQSGQFILLDTGFLFGLFSPRDERHDLARRVYSRIEKHHGVLPWPVLYEAVNTKLVRRAEHLLRFKTLLQAPGVHRISHEPYRERALKECLDGEGGSASLVDRILGGIVLDLNVRLDAVVTFNPRDFARAARRRGIEMISE